MFEPDGPEGKEEPRKNKKGQIRRLGKVVDVNKIGNTNAVNNASPKPSVENVERTAAGIFITSNSRTLKETVSESHRIEGSEPDEEPLVENNVGGEKTTLERQHLKILKETIKLRSEEIRLLGLTNTEYENLHTQLGYTVEDLQHFSESVNAAKDSITKMVDGFIAARGKTNDVEAIGFYNDAITTLNSHLASIENFSMRQAFALEGQNPASLRVPTAEAYAQRKVVEIEEARVQRAIRNSASAEEQQPRPITREDVTRYMETKRGFNQDYEEDTRDWFQKNLEILESTGLTFEEQAEHFSRVSMAVNHLRLDAKTRGLGEEFHSKMETRRNVQRMARVWDLMPPDGIAQQAGIMKKDLLRDMFCLRSKVVGSPTGEERPLIAERVVELEDMALEVDKAINNFWKLIKEGHSGFKKDGDKEVGANEAIIGFETNKIRDFCHLGGYVTNDSGEVLLRSGRFVPKDRIVWEDKTRADGTIRRRDQPVFADQAIKVLRGNVMLDDGTFKSENKVTVTDRVVLKQDTVKNAANLRTSSESELKIQQLEQQRWSVTMASKLWSMTGKAASHEVQVNGAGDFFMDRVMNYGRWLYRRPLLDKTEGIWMPKMGKYANRPFDLKMDDYFVGTLGISPKKEENLTNLGLVRDRDYYGHNEKDNRGMNVFVVDKVVGLRGKKILDYISDPKKWDAKGEQKLEGAYSNDFVDNFVNADATRKLVWGPGSFFMNPTKEKFIEMLPVWRQVSEGGRREVFGEVLERSLEFMNNDPKAKTVIEETKYFKSLEMYLWIKEANNNMMLTDETVDRFFKTYLGPKLPFNDMDTSAMRWMQIKTILDMAIHPLNAGEYFIMNPLRKLLQEIFGQTIGEGMSAPKR